MLLLPSLFDIGGDVHTYEKVDVHVQRDHSLSIA